MWQWKITTGLGYHSTNDCLATERKFFQYTKTAFYLLVCYRAEIVALCTEIYDTLHNICCWIVVAVPIVLFG